MDPPPAGNETAVAPSLAFGCKSGVADNVCFLDEENVVFPTGSMTVLHNIEQDTQRFITGTDGQTAISAMAVSPNRRYIAVAAEGDQATVTIYDLHSLKRRKVSRDNKGACVCVC